MIKIKVSSGNNELSELLLRQTPRGTGIWGDCQFLVNQPVDTCDWWVVCHSSGLEAPEETVCDPDHIVYISMEPQEWSTSGFINQFSKLVICDRLIKHPEIMYRNGLTWWVGISVNHINGHHFSREVRFSYDDFMAMPPPIKSKKISLICSRKSVLPGHQKRLAFIDKLALHPIGSHVDFFGGGIHPISDKWDAIESYQYHIVLENNEIADYWSEKLADCYLGFALPLYSGCPNIDDYFFPSSLRKLNIHDFEGSVRLIEEIIDTDPYDAHLGEIIKARNKVLNDYNIFNLMSEICHVPAVKMRKCCIKPSNYWRESLTKRLVHNFSTVCANTMKRYHT